MRLDSYIVRSLGRRKLNMVVLYAIMSRSGLGTTLFGAQVATVPPMLVVPTELLAVDVMVMSVRSLARVVAA